MLIDLTGEIIFCVQEKPSFPAGLSSGRLTQDKPDGPTKGNLVQACPRQRPP